MYLAYVYFNATQIRKYYQTCQFFIRVTKLCFLTAFILLSSRIYLYLILYKLFQVYKKVRTFTFAAFYSPPDKQIFQINRAISLPFNKSSQPAKAN